MRSINSRIICTKPHQHCIYVLLLMYYYIKNILNKVRNILNNILTIKQQLLQRKQIFFTLSEITGYEIILNKIQQLLHMYVLHKSINYSFSNRVSWDKHDSLGTNISINFFMSSINLWCNVNENIYEIITNTKKC